MSSTQQPEYMDKIYCKIDLQWLSVLLTGYRSTRYYVAEDAGERGVKWNNHEALAERSK